MTKPIVAESLARRFDEVDAVDGVIFGETMPS